MNPDAPETQLLVRVLEHNADQLAAVQKRVDEARERELNEWRSRALEAEDKLARIQLRFINLLEIDYDG